LKIEPDAQSVRQRAASQQAQWRQVHISHTGMTLKHCSGAGGNRLSRCMQWMANTPSTTKTFPSRTTLESSYLSFLIPGRMTVQHCVEGVTARLSECVLLISW